MTDSRLFNMYTWTHPDGSNPPNITDRWTFPASRHDTGTYKVSVSNGVGDQGYCTSNITVQFPSSCTLHNDATTVNETDTVSLYVNTTGNPPVNMYTWTHPDGSSPPNITDRWTFPASRHDTGTYKVSVSNGVGERGYCTSNVTVQFAPVAVTPKSVIIKNSKNASLQCTAQGEPEPTLTWTSTTNKPLQIRDNGKTVVLINATLEDSGNYTCTAKNILGASSNTSNVIVTYPVGCTIHPDSPNVAVNESESVTLTCGTTGNLPVNKFSWTYPNGTKLPGTSVLQYTPSRMDIGMYQCFVENSIGDSGNCTRKVIVQYKAVLVNISSTAKEENGIVIANETDSFNLTCTSYANPAATYKWTVPEPSLFTELNQQVLVVNNVTKKHTGRYVCTASNIVGETSTSKNLSIYLKFRAPEITNPYKQVVAAGDYVSLVCNASGYPVPNITWTMDGAVIGVGRTLNITRARKNDSSCYTCTADNGVGHAKNASICLNVQYSPSGINILPSRRQLMLKEGDTLHLHCQSDGNPLPTYTWRHNAVALSDGQKGVLVIDSINRRQNGTYQCEAKNRLGSITSKPIEIVVQYLEYLEVIRPSNKSYSQSNPLVLFNLSVNAHPSNASLSCNPSAPNILTAITSHDAGVNVKQYLVFVAIKGVVESASIECKAEHSVGVRNRTLYLYRRRIPFKETVTGQFKIANQKWEDELKDAKSTGYNDLKKKCIKILEAAYDGAPYLAAIEIKEFLKGSIITRFGLDVIDQVPDPLMPLRDYVKAQVGDINGLQIDHSSIQKSVDIKDNSPIPTERENQALVAILGVLFGLSVVLNIVFIVGFLWLRRKDSKGNSAVKRKTNSDERGQINDISLQETSFTDDTTPNVPEYEPIGRRGLATSNAGIPEYEAVTRRTQQAQPQPGVQTSHPMPQYESTDGQGQTGVVMNPPPVTYQTIQPRTGDYGSLSPLTRLPPKGTVLSSTGSPTRTGQYQALQHKGVSPQYQSLDDLSKC